MRTKLNVPFHHIGSFTSGCKPLVGTLLFIKDVDQDRTSDTASKLLNSVLFVSKKTCRLVPDLPTYCVSPLITVIDSYVGFILCLHNESLTVDTDLDYQWTSAIGLLIPGLAVILQITA